MSGKASLSKLSKILTITIILTGLSVQAQEARYTCFSRQKTWGLSFGSGACGSSVIGGYEGTTVIADPSHYVSFTEDKDGGVQFTIGPAPSHSPGGAGDLRPRKERPSTIPIPVDSSLNAFSEFTEVIPGSGIFLGARHSLQNIQFGGLSLALARDSRFANSKVRIFGFRQANRKGEVENLDALILVLQKDRGENEIPGNILPSHTTSDELKFQIQTLLGSEKFTTTIQPEDLFYSYQMTPDHARGQKNLQDSLGPIYSVSENGHIAFLPLGGKNYTAPGSSGSLIFVLPKENRTQQRSAWKIGGVVSCGVLRSNTNPSEMLFSKIEVITTKALYESEIYEISESELRNETRPNDPACIPLDGRKGGGF